MFSPGKGTIVVFLIIAFFLIFFLPVVNCKESHKASKKICTLYSICYTDFYYPVAGLLLMWGTWESTCPDGNVGPLLVVTYLALLIILSALIAYLLNYYYRKYRDI
jgi:hypothetical protein